MKKTVKKITVALSGGVDSAASAALLKSQGHDVTGVFMLQFDEDIEKTIVCTQRDDKKDALAVAAHLGIPFEVWDFRKEYKRHVIRYMLAEYKAGRTPNPDVMCNTFIKFGYFLKKARKEGADAIATGHYVRVKKKEGRFALLQGKDKNKDQSYFLYGLTQEQLAHCMFPVGDLTKPEVRALAKKFKLPNADKKDSQGVCFVGEIAMLEFLKGKIRMKPGPLMTLDGARVGTHQGAGYYTIGQRHGLGFPGGGQAMYVVGKDMKKNIVYVAPGEKNPALYTRELAVTEMNWIAGKQPRLPLACTARIRYRQPLQSSRLSKKKPGLIATFSKPQRAVTPGQIIVLYKGQEMLGGGIINL